MLQCRYDLSTSYTGTDNLLNKQYKRVLNDVNVFEILSVKCAETTKEKLEIMRTIHILMKGMRST